MQKLVGDPNPPFTHAEGSADRPKGVGGWVYAVGFAVATGIAGIIYKQKQHVKL